MRLAPPKVPGPYGMDPALRLDFLSADELAGQGVTLLPATAPPSINQGMVLDGATQYAYVRAGFVLPQQFTMYIEFVPNFNYDIDVAYTIMSGDSASAGGWLFKNTNVNSNRLFWLIGAGSIYVNGANYGAFWRTGQRNKLCLRCISGTGAMYLNGVALVTANVVWTTVTSNNYYIGGRYDAAYKFNGTFYDFRIYTRLMTAAEAIELTTLT